jgi:membrane-associated phospholipid phosphatase
MCQSASGQPLAQTNDRPLWQQDIDHILNVSAGLYTAPLRFDQSDWGRLALSLSLTGFTFAMDPSVNSIARNSQSDINNVVFGLDRHFGGRITVSLAAGLYGAGYILQNNQIRRSGLYAFEAYLLTWSITKVLKYGFGRRRPHAGNDPLHFQPFKGGDTFSSLPSGHTTGAFSFAFVMSHMYENWLWKAAWLGSASLVAGARIYHNHHWISDTVLSFVISYAVAEYVVHFDDNQEDSSAGQLSLKIAPVINGQSIGIALSLAR